MRRISSLAALALLLAGCSMRPSGTSVLQPEAPTLAHPQVQQRGGGASWVKFTPHTLGALGTGIIAGPDGAMWFIDENASSLVRLNMSGGFKEFSMPPVTGSATALTLGADKKFYVTDGAANIVRVTTSGVATALPIPSGDITQLGTDTLGPDGNVWFPESAHLGTVNPAGTVTEFKYPASFATPNQYGTITTGADGNIWFGETSDNAVVRFNLATHVFTEFRAPSSCDPLGLVKARDGNIWFGCLASAPQYGRVSKTGAFTLFPGGGAYGAQETMQISTLAPDGQPWFESGNNNIIFRVNIPADTISSFSPPFNPSERPDSIAEGPDGNLWVTTVGLQNVYVYVTHPITLSPRSLTFSAPGLQLPFTVKEGGTTSWTAKSTNAAVATVAQGGQANTFVVTSVGVGSCSIEVSDAIGNFAFVKITVT